MRRRATSAHELHMHPYMQGQARETREQNDTRASASVELIARVSSNSEGRVRGYGLVLVECDQSDLMSLLVMLYFELT